MPLLLCKASELNPGEARRFSFDGRPPIALFRLDDGFYATDDTCTHAQGSLSEGFVEDGCVVCPVHPGEFDIRSGRACGFPAEKDLATYAVRVAEGQVLLDIEG